jgi:hypothetical protein
MRNKKWTAESGLYLVILILALLVRLFQLGQNPLSEGEADLALRALSLARGETVAFGAQSAYVLLTGSLFYLFQSTAFLARLLPALFGSLLVAIPFLLREQLGKKAGLLFALFLAIDPALLATSRQADSLMITVASLLLVGVFVIKKQSVLTGIFLALAFLSGPDLWPGLLMLAAAGAMLPIRKKRLESGFDLPGFEGLQGFAWKKSLAWFAACIFLTGTLFFIVPEGIGGAVASMPAYFGGWTRASAVSFQRIFVALLAYEGLALIFGVWGIVAVAKQGIDVDRFFRNWALFAVLLVVIYPSRQEIDLVWAMIPLLGLAARVIARWLESEPEPRWIASVLMLGITVLFILAWINLVSVSIPVLSEMDLQLRYIRLAATVAVIALLVLLVGWGWSVSAAKSGFVWGLASVLLVYTLSASWHASGMGPHPEAELWLTGSYTTDADLIEKTVGDLSAQYTGERTRGEVTVLGVDSQALEWLLRDVDKARFVDTLPLDAQPAIVISPSQQELGLAASYTGQDFVLQQSPAWSLLLRPEWMGWLNFREVVLQENNIVLWARSDLFPMGIGAPAVEIQE